MSEYNKQINKIKTKRKRALYLRYLIAFLCLGICLGLVLFKAKSNFNYQDNINNIFAVSLQVIVIK